MKILWAGLLWLGVTTLGTAETKAVPSEVLAWYQDTMDMYTTLIQGLGQATGAPATAQALQKATAAVKGKRLAQRYHDLEAKYPQLFRNGGDSTWAPPPEWIQVSQKYAEVLSHYGSSLQKAAAWMRDPAVSRAFRDFGQAMAELGEPAS